MRNACILVSYLQLFLEFLPQFVSLSIALDGLKRDGIVMRCRRRRRYDFNQFRQYDRVAFVSRLKLVQPVVVDGKADISDSSPFVRCRLLTNTLGLPLALSALVRRSRSLTNCRHRMNHSRRLCVGRCSKKLKTDKPSRSMATNALCKSRSEVESSTTSARMDGLEPSGRRACAASRPGAPKLDPRCGVPRKRMALVHSAI